MFGLSREGGEDALDAGGGAVAVFVYGTLKAGSRSVLSGTLPGLGCHSPRRTSVRGFTLYSVRGMFPAAVRAFGGVVRGERWIIPPSRERAVLERLDGIEGVPVMYDRVIVATDAGPAWMYLWQMEVGGLAHVGEWWPEHT